MVESSTLVHLSTYVGEDGGEPQKVDVGGMLTQVQVTFNQHRLTRSPSPLNGRANWVRKLACPATTDVQATTQERTGQGWGRSLRCRRGAESTR